MYGRWPAKNEPGRIYAEGLIRQFFAFFGSFAAPRPEAAPRRRSVSARKVPARIGQRRRRR
ncbi:hypothetical protein [Hamadaea tsunoensis]|uniref:hypothetical protein n=1 Tax=Hamadaea tsunoensis TaxID=53368 RepID=UPI000406FF9B|nr:hypothetical protein [Hamadaea tsunoensis]